MSILQVLPLFCRSGGLVFGGLDGIAGVDDVGPESDGGLQVDRFLDYIEY